MKDHSSLLVYNLPSACMRQWHTDTAAAEPQVLSLLFRGVFLSVQISVKSHTPLSSPLPSTAATAPTVQHLNIFNQVNKVQTCVHGYVQSQLVPEMNKIIMYILCCRFLTQGQQYFSIRKEDRSSANHCLSIVQRVLFLLTTLPVNNPYYKQYFNKYSYA